MRRGMPRQPGAEEALELQGRPKDRGGGGGGKEERAVVLGRMEDAKEGS